MSTPSNIDVTAPFDPTGYTSITGAQLLQLVSGLIPYSDKGFVVVTVDVAGVPEVPDAVTTTKWKNYVWLRITASAAIPYIWNPNAASDVTYLKWQTIAASSIGVGTITGDMIKDNTIPSSKIISLDASKLYGTLPGTISANPSGPAGGDLTGTYPDPSIANLAITTGKIALLNITNALIANFTIDATTKIAPNGAAFTQLRTNAGTTALEFFVPQKIVNLTDPVGADAYKNVRVNSTGTGFEIATAGTTVQTLAKAIAGNLSVTTVVPMDNTIPDSATEGTLIASLAITPISATNLIRVKFSAWVTTSVAGGAMAMFLIKTGSAAAVQTVYKTNSANGEANMLTLDYVVAAGGTSAITFSVYAGPDSGTGYVNRSQGGALFGATAQSYLIIEEIQGTLT